MYFYTLKYIVMRSAWVLFKKKIKHNLNIYSSKSD